MNRHVAQFVLVFTALALALALPIGTPRADAQEPAEQVDYGGPFRPSDSPSQPASDDLGAAFVAPDIAPSTTAGDTTTVGGTGGGSTLAATGYEVEASLAISIGLLSVGGAALVSSRRRRFADDY